MTTGPLSQCGTCQRLQSPFDAATAAGVAGPWCEAFPEGIPVDIYGNDVDHRNPVDGDHGLQWVALPGASYPRIFRFDTVTAAARPADQGAMIALVPTADWAQQSAVEDGLPAEELHVTLAYLGGAPLPEGDRAKLQKIAQNVAAGFPPVQAEVFSAALFNPLGDEPCVTLGLTGGDLDHFQQTVMKQLGTYEVDTSASKRPWVAHLTLTYTDDQYAVADVVDRCGPVSFDRVRVAIGGEVIDYQLGQPGPEVDDEPMTAPNEPCPPGQHLMPDGTCMDAEQMPDGTQEYHLPGKHNQKDHGKSKGPKYDRSTPPGMGGRRQYAADGTTFAVGDTTLGPGEYETLDLPEMVGGTPWHVYLPEGVWSGDNRQLAPGSLQWDQALLPYPVLWQPANMPGHDGAVIAGRIDGIARVGLRVCVWGVLDDAGDAGAEVKRLIEGGFLRGASPTIDDTDVELICAEPVMNEMGMVEADACATEPKMLVHHGRLRSVTFVAEPAFPEALVTLELPPPEVLDAAIIAAGYTITIPNIPPESWFTPPAEPPSFGALHVTDQGRVFGYLAPAHIAHRAFRASGQVVTAPRNVDYAEFQNKPALVSAADGSVHRINAGNVTFGCGHMAPNDPRRANPTAALEHYDNSCSVAARVRVGEDAHGTWVAGALLSSIDADTVERMMACALSGDWQGGRLNAALLVPVEGFPVPVQGQVRIKDGAVVASTTPIKWGATVAANTPEEGPDLGSVFDRIARSIGQDAQSRMTALTARINARRGE